MLCSQYASGPYQNMHKEHQRNASVICIGPPYAVFFLGIEMCVCEQTKRKDAFSNKAEHLRQI
jgi:hypothetical protein